MSTSVYRTTDENPPRIWGYDQIRPAFPSNWATGHLRRDPRPFHSIKRASAWTSIATGALCGISLLALTTLPIRNLLLLGAIIGLGILLSVAMVNLVYHSSLNRFREINRWALKRAGLPDYGTIWFFQPRLPKEASDAYKKAKESGLFKTIMIAAPLHMFERREACGDPIIFGEMSDGKTYRIFEFNF